MSLPRVGLTWPRTAPRTPAVYISAIEAAGGLPVLITPQTGLEPLYTVDALVLAGGLDFHPRYYGQDIDQRVADTLEIDEERDALEIDVMRWAIEEDLPTLGICRGVQALNVAMGGTLVQDLSLLGLEPRSHEGRQRDPRPPEWQPIHEVRLGRRSRLRRVFGCEVLPVNSFHHQAVDRAGQAMEIVARSADGVVEALEARDYRFLIGVQWHPERMRPQSTVQAVIFEELLAEARRTRNGHGGPHPERGPGAHPAGS